MIIVPTREIATQVCSVIKAIGTPFHKLTCNSFIGGLPLFEDQEKAVMSQIIIGTPGEKIYRSTYYYCYFELIFLQQKVNLGFL